MICSDIIPSTAYAAEDTNNTVSFYNNETYLGEIYIYDMNTIIVKEENSLMKYLTDADLLEYFAEIIESLE